MAVNNQEGKTNLIKKLPKYNEAAKHHGSWVVVVDLDRQAESAAAYVKVLVNEPSERFVLCVAVQAMESWILADRAHFAQYFGVPQQQVPGYPDQEDDPKQVLLSLVRKHSRKSIREDMLPLQGCTSKVGPGYVNQVATFMQHEKHPWRPTDAAENSPSLAQCIHLLKEVDVD